MPAGLSWNAWLRPRTDAAQGNLQSLSGGPSVPVPALRGAIVQLELAQRSGALDADELRRLLAERPRRAG